MLQEKSRENSFNDVIDTKPNRVSPVHGKVISDQSFFHTGLIC